MSYKWVCECGQENECNCKEGEECVCKCSACDKECGENECMADDGDEEEEGGCCGCGGCGGGKCA